MAGSDHSYQPISAPPRLPARMRHRERPPTQTHRSSSEIEDGDPLANQPTQKGSTGTKVTTS